MSTKIFGGGKKNTAMAMKFAFSEDLTNEPQIEAFDNELPDSFPDVIAANQTTLNQAFVGTTGNGNLPMFAAAAGGLESAGDMPPVDGGVDTDWHPTAAIPGGAAVNLLKGLTNFVVADNVPLQNEEFIFNLSLKIPYDTVIGDSMFGVAIQLRYRYSGTTPIVTAFYNDAAAGSESDPSWVEFDLDGSDGLLFTDDEPAADELSLPSSGQKIAEELRLYSD